MSDNSDTSNDKSLEQIDDICRDYLRNVCKRGKRCKYRHPHPNEARELGRKHEYTFCHDFQNTGCRRANCKFIHCTREEEEYYKQTGQLPVRLQQAAALGIGVVPNEMPLLKGEVPICKDFLKGECKRGSRCKYRHLSSTEYDYEVRRSDVAPPTSHSDRYDVYTNDDYDTYEYVSNPSPLKRRKLEVDEIENIYNHHNHNNNHIEIYRPISRTTPVPVDYRLLEEENVLLRRKVEELSKQVSDLAATNEVLLEQNARYRTNKVNACSMNNTVTSSPIVTVSQVVTPTITPAPAIARSTIIQRQIQLNSTMPQLTLNANSELIVSNPQGLGPRLTSSLSSSLATELAAVQAQQASIASITSSNINPAVSISPQTTIVPVSMTMEAMPAPAAAPPLGSIATVSLSQAQVQNMQTRLSLTPTTPMVSYPIMSHTSLSNSSLG